MITHNGRAKFDQYSPLVLEVSSRYGSPSPRHFGRHAALGIDASDWTHIFPLSLFVTVLHRPPFEGALSFVQPLACIQVKAIFVLRLQFAVHNEWNNSAGRRSWWPRCRVLFLLAALILDNPSVLTFHSWCQA